MRPLLVACVIAFSGALSGLTASGVGAEVRTPGDGCLVVQNGFGVVTVNITQGVVFGRVGAGVVTVEDTAVDDGKVARVKGAQTKTVIGNRTRYESESTIRFRASGPTKLTLNAQFINLSLVGRGVAILSAAGFTDVPGQDTNLFSYDAASFCEDNFETLPAKPTRYMISSPEGQ